MELEQVVADVFGVEPDHLDDGAGPATVAGWTSLRHLTLVVALERTYNLRFSYDEIVELRTLGDIRRALTARGAL